MPSEPVVYVWAFLLGRAEPVVVGRLDEAGGLVSFTYARSYLERPEAFALYGVPLRTGPHGPPAGTTVHGCFTDAGPDAWGQRVVLHRLTGKVGRDLGTAEVPLFTYLLGSASDRAGALDFQTSSTTYEPRDSKATLSDMVGAVDLLLGGEAIPASLEAALFHGTTMGGARPKVTLVDGGLSLIAKLATSDDPYPVVKAEGAAMTLASMAGIDVPKVEVTRCAGKDVLLVERFDRAAAGDRLMFVSALTVLGLPEEAGRYATYYDFADRLRAEAAEPAATLRELFSRIVFNILVSNTDDHARNHAAFWDGNQLRLTPAYDITPAMRLGGEQQQAMAIARDGWRFSQLAGCVRAARDYLLHEAEARAIIDAQLGAVRTHWDDAADAARLTKAERRQLWGRQILNPYCLEGYRAA
jgi:serine/threonine-protein kinase HipA